MRSRDIFSRLRLRGSNPAPAPAPSKTVRRLRLRLRAKCIGSRRGSRISARGGRQGIDDLIWDGDERFLTYTNTNLQFFKMFIAILFLNGVEQPFKRHHCPFFLPLRRRNPRLRRGSLRPRGGRPPQRPPPPGSAPGLRL